MVSSKFLGADVIKLPRLTGLQLISSLNLLWFLYRQLQLASLHHFAGQDLRFSRGALPSSSSRPAHLALTSEEAVLNTQGRSVQQVHVGCIPRRQIATNRQHMLFKPLPRHLPLQPPEFSLTLHNIIL